MRPLAKVKEEELLGMSRESNRDILTGLSVNNIVPHIEKTLKSFITNEIKDGQGNKLIDRSEVIAEDIILASYIKRKTFAFFFHSYTQNAVMHTLLAAELDAYTTQEHLLTVKAIILNS